MYTDPKILFWWFIGILLVLWKNKGKNLYSWQAVPYPSVCDIQLQNIRHTETSKTMQIWGIARNKEYYLTANTNTVSSLWNIIFCNSGTVCSHPGKIPL